MCGQAWFFSNLLKKQNRFFDTVLSAEKCSFVMVLPSNLFLAIPVTHDNNKNESSIVENLN